MSIHDELAWLRRRVYKMRELAIFSNQQGNE